MGISPLLSTPEIPAVGQVITIPTASPEISVCEEEKVGVSLQHGLHAAGSRTVVAKPLHPNQTLPPSIRTNLVSMDSLAPVTSPALSQLSGLPKLTQQMLLAGISSLQQQQLQQQLQQQKQQQQLLSQQMLTHQVMQMLPMPTGMVPSSSGGAMGGVSSGGKIPRAKPIMPKQAMFRQGGVATPSYLVPQIPQKIIAPLAIPPPLPTTLTLTPSIHPSTPIEPSPSSSTQALPRQTITTNKPRKPCNCKNSQCLKLYCDCFANGEFCREACNCHSCKNNMEFAEDRAKAVKLCLDRNPHAFKPKVGQNKSGDKRRHIKGCNCKRSGCLKNYCECYEAKIPCSANCRCIGCKNVQEKPENKSLMHLADAADIRTQQQRAATSHFIEQLEITSSKPQPRTLDGNRLPFSFINKEVARATCLCLLEEASHASMVSEASMNDKPLVDVERAVLEEFGRCMTQIINSTQTANEDDTVYVH